MSETANNRTEELRRFQTQLETESIRDNRSNSPRWIRIGGALTLTVLTFIGIVMMLNHVAKSEYDEQAENSSKRKKEVRKKMSVVKDADSFVVAEKAANDNNRVSKNRKIDENDMSLVEEDNIDDDYNDDDDEDNDDNDEDGKTPTNAYQPGTKARISNIRHLMRGIETTHGHLRRAAQTASGMRHTITRALRPAF